MLLFQGTVSPDGCVVSLPGAITLFHWPRSDFDPLLCVRFVLFGEKLSLKTQKLLFVFVSKLLWLQSTVKLNLA